MNRLVVLSYDLRVLCCNKGRLFAYPLVQFESDSSLAFLCPDGKGNNFCNFQSASQWLDLQTMSFHRTVPRGSIKLEERISDRGIFRLKICNTFDDEDTGSYLFIKESGEVYVSENEEARRQRNGAFRCVSYEEFKALRDFVRSDWVYDKALNSCSVNLVYSNIWDIHIGDYIVDIGSSLNNIVNSYNKFYNFDLVIKAVNDNVTKFVKFNPAILYVITKEDQLLRFSFALRCLEKNAQFDGTIFIASNLKPEYILPIIPRIFRDMVILTPIRQDDFVDYTFPLLSILNSINIEEFFPVVVLDEAVFVTMSLRPYLIEAALNPLPYISSRRASHRQNIFMDNDASSGNGFQIFADRKIRGSIAFLQNKAFLQTALFSYRALIKKKDFVPYVGSEADFIEYLSSKCSLILESAQRDNLLEDRFESLFMDVSSWPLEKCDRYIERSDNL